MSSPPPAAAAPVLTRTFEVASGGRCRLRVPRAAVELSAGTGGEAEVALAAADDTAPDAAQALADNLHVRYGEGVLSVEPKRPPRLDARDWRVLRKGAPVLTLRVRVPASFGADVHASGGAIDARDLRGSVTLEATGGTIRATGLGGRLDVHARRCQTTVTGFNGKKLSAHVHGGAFAVHDVDAETVDIKSTASRLQIEAVEAALQLAAQNGQAGVTDLRGALDADVCGGRLSFTPEPGHEVRLHAPGSDVRLHLPGGFASDVRFAAARLLANFDGFDGERSARHAEGALNGGGARCEATAPGGTLRCDPAPDDG